MTYYGDHNQKISDFYKDNQHISFVTVNLTFIELFEKVNNDKSLLDKSNNSLNQTININKKFNDFEILLNNKINEIIPLLDNNNNLINNIINKNDNSCIIQIKNIIESFNISLINDTCNLIKNNDSLIIKDFINNFELKSSLMYQNIQQPLYSFIIALEERINNNINNLKENIKSNNSTALNNINILKNKKELLISILNKLYDTSEIIVFNTKNYIYLYPNVISNVYVFKRLSKLPILINSIDVDRNINSDEIELFYKIIDDNKNNAIFLSQNSGISLKSNYYIEYYHENIIIFIHNVEYNSYKIKIAIDIIDNLSEKIKNFKNIKNENSEFNIDSQLLEEINNEFIKFINQKELLINILKDNQKNILSIIEEINFLTLDKFLSTKFIETKIKKTSFICDICNKYNGHNLKAIAAHKRKCKKVIIN